MLDVSLFTHPWVRLFHSLSTDGGGEEHNMDRGDYRDITAACSVRTDSAWWAAWDRRYGGYLNISLIFFCTWGVVVVMGMVLRVYGWQRRGRYFCSIGCGLGRLPSVRVVYTDDGRRVYLWIGNASFNW